MKAIEQHFHVVLITTFQFKALLCGYSNKCWWEIFHVWKLFLSAWSAPLKAPVVVIHRVPDLLSQTDNSDIWTHLTKSGAFDITCSNSANESWLSSSRSASSNIWKIKQEQINACWIKQCLRHHSPISVSTLPKVIKGEITLQTLAKTATVTKSTTTI